MASCTLSKHYTIDRAPVPAHGRFLKGVVLETWTKSPLLKQKLLTGGGGGGGILTIKQVENREEQALGQEVCQQQRGKASFPWGLLMKHHDLGGLKHQRRFYSGCRAEDSEALQHRTLTVPEALGKILSHLFCASGSKQQA